MIVIGRGDTGHTDATDVPSQRRMQQNRVETRYALYNSVDLSRHRDKRGSD